jgi:hypothetical protein
LVIDRQDKTQVITTGTNQVRSYDAATGEVIWRHAGLTVNCIPSPLAHENSVIVMSGYQGSVATAISLDATGDATGCAVVARASPRL